MSQVIYEEKGAQNEPSPSIWKDCPKGLLRDRGQGYFVREDFLGATVDTLAASEQRPNYGDLSIDCDDDTVVSFISAKQGGFLDLETDGDDNDAWALFTQPFAQIVLFSQNKTWFEVGVEVGALADQGAFVGFAEEAALTRDVVADAAGDVATESMHGFQLLATDTDAWDAIYRLDAGTTVEILSDVTNAVAIPVADRASVVADTQVKLGQRFDGADKLHTYVNGIRVAVTTLDATTFPDNVLFGGIVALKTGTAAAQSGAFDWAQFAHQTRR